MSGLTETRFADVRSWTSSSDDRPERTIFENCTLPYDFSYADLRGLNLDGATFTSVRFDKAALAGVTFRVRRYAMCPSADRTVSTSARWLSMGANGQADLRWAQAMGAELSNVTVA